MFPSHVDLHLHTDRSDGDLDPAALAEWIRRERPDLELVAVAERDTLVGSLRFAALLPGIALPAIELSTRLRDIAVGLVGLGIADPSRLAGVLRRDEIEQARWALIRAANPSWELTLFLPPDETSAAIALARELIARGHLADADASVVAFARRLESDGGPADNRRSTPVLALLPELTRAIGTLHAAGALAIVARPGATAGWSDPIADLRDLAISHELDGFEAYRPEHSSAMRTKLVQLAYRMDMLASAGSGARLTSDPIGQADGRPTHSLQHEIERRIRAWR